MLSHDVLVDTRAPAGAGGNRQLTVSDLRYRGQLLAPRNIVHVDLQHAYVRNRSAPLSRDERREMGVVVVRRAVDFECLRQVGDLLRLVEAVPDHVHRRDVERARFEEWAKAAVRIEVLAAADRDGRPATYDR